MILSPTFIIYRNSVIGNSDSVFLTRKQYLFSDGFPTEICGIPVSEAEIPIPDPPARGAVPAEFPTKPETGQKGQTVSLHTSIVVKVDKYY